MNPEKTDDVYVEHMLDCIAWIEGYTGLDKSTFLHSRLIQDAVIRNLQTMAESSRRLSNEIKAIRPEIPWRDIAGFRNILVHDYLGIDLSVVWSVVELELPRLKQALIAMKEKLQQASG